MINEIMNESPEPDVTPVIHASQIGEDTPVKYDDTASPNCTDTGPTDVDDEVQMFQNPEPPKELVERHLIDADNIGDTVFSKHWLFTTLMRLLQVIV